MLRDAKRGIYKRVVIEDNRVRGAVLYGDVKDGPWYFELMTQGRDVGPLRDKLLFGAAFARTMSERHVAIAIAGSATTCPTAASAAACIAQPPDARSADGDAIRDRAAIRSIRPTLGRLCSKGSALGETLGLDGRLLHPHRARRARELGRGARSCRTGLPAHHRSARTGRGRVLRLRPAADRGLLRRQQADEGLHRHAPTSTPTRACACRRPSPATSAPSAKTWCRSATTTSTLADLVVLVGSNTAWCHPILFQRIAAAKQQRPELKIVVIDPRRTATCEFADLHLPVRAGTDVWLFNGLLAFLHQHGVVDTEFVASTHGGLRSRAAGRARTRPATCVRSRRSCGIDERRLAEFYSLFARTEKTLTLFSQGVNQSSAGTDKVNSIINCHLLTGRIGRPGHGPVLDHRPAERDGRARSRRPGEHAGGAHGARRSRSIAASCSSFWNSPAIADSTGTQGRRPVRRDPRRPRQGGVDHGDQSGRSACRTPTRCKRRCGAANSSSCRTALQRTDTNALRPRAAARGRLGREGRHGDELRPPHLAPARLPAVARRREAGLVDHQSKSRSAWVTRRASTSQSAHEIFVEHAALSGVAQRRRARVRHQRPRAR